MMLDRAAIARRVPHAGAMCLLDAVTQWDALRITCTSAAPGPDHPLARDAAVPAVAAVEYAAQAAAVHAALTANRTGPRAGLLAKIAQTDLHDDCLPTAGGPLVTHAECLGHNAAGCLYRFEMCCGPRTIARGRLMVAFTEA